MKDLYEILQVTKDVDGDTLKQHYRKRAFATHPDRNKHPEAAKQFQEISEAYEILRHPESRSLYDTGGYECIQDSPVNAFELFRSLFNVDFGQDMNTNVFFFSDVSERTITVSPDALVYRLDVTLDEFYHGAQKEFVVETKDSQDIWKQTKYVLNLKPGTCSKDYLVVSGGGHYNKDTQSQNDLHVTLQDVPHSLYKRQGNDLLREYTISLCDALCGATLHFQHFQTPLHITIDTIVKPNCYYKIYGQGMPLKQVGNTLGNMTTSNTSPTKGDLLLDLTIDFPTHVSDDTKKSLRQLFDSGDVRNVTDSTSLQAYYYRDKEEVVRELLEDEETGGCLQQ